VNIVVAVIVIVVVLAVVGIIVFAMRRTPGQVVPTEAPQLADPTPMTGLESALEQVIDRSGRPMRDRLDDESDHVDGLRVPDDTGPLLRRALDHVARPGDEADPTAPEADGSATS
jgi:hypothetical protein